MTSIIFELPPDSWQPAPSDAEYEHQKLLAMTRRMSESLRQMQEEEARLASRPEERLVNLKMPTEMIDRLDQIAKDAGTSRSQLMRQVISDFMNYVWANGISFRGSLLEFKHRRLSDATDELR